MIKCQYCNLVFTAASQITADNAYILHVAKEHKDNTKATLPTLEQHTGFEKEKDLTYEEEKDLIRDVRHG